MAAPWLELRDGADTRRIPLDRSVLRLGGAGADVPVSGITQGQLHVWTAPPKAVRVGGGPELFVAGKRVEEALLEPGVVAVWGPLELSVGGVSAVLEELPHEAPAADGAPAALRGAGAGGGPNARRLHERLVAGLAVELGLADRDTTKRWQGSVVRNEWDPDACAREVLDRSALDPEDPRLLERAGRLERDLVMASFQRGLGKAARRARGAARQGSAILIANLVAFLCYTLIVIAVAFLLRVRWDWSFDGLIDRAVGVFS